jgi:sulfur carrier protein ThiS
MEVFLQKEGKKLDVEHRGSAKSLLERLGVNPEVVLIVKDGVLVTEAETIDDAEKIELLSVISGG